LVLRECAFLTFDIRSPHFNAPGKLTLGAVCIFIYAPTASVLVRWVVEKIERGFALRCQ
jgi:hypothetical protein